MTDPDVYGLAGQSGPDGAEPDGTVQSYYNPYREPYGR